jgi:hypothetical protein
MLIVQGARAFSARLVVMRISCQKNDLRMIAMAYGVSP